jgi:hypothetical protein
MKQRALVVLLGLLCVCVPATARAGVPQWPQKQAGVKSRAPMRHAHKAPKHDQVHRGGVDGAITLIQFISTRRPHDPQHTDALTSFGSTAQVPASAEHAGGSRPGTVTIRVVDSLPPHWGSTHLCV